MNAEVATWILNSEKITSRFGLWPSFHDAEVIELSLWRGHIDPEKREYTFPILNLKLHHWLLTNKVDAKGYFVLEKHTISTIRFCGIEECRIEGLDHQNAIFSLGIEKKKKSDSESAYYLVTLEPAFGIDAQFTCNAIDVVESVPADKDGAELKT